MAVTIPDALRKQSIESLFSTETFSNCWTVWQPKIKNILGPHYSENAIINLGDHLSEIFKTTGSTGRGQGELSGSGTAWESLVCWYLNLCFIGSRIVAMRKMSLVPKPIQDAITVNYGNFACNTESDITIIVFPDLPVYNNTITDISLERIYGCELPVISRRKLNSDFVNFIVARDFGRFEIGIIQCKTNWNDNAQVPMLWDMIYSAGGFSGRNITIGRNTFSIQSARAFTYSFVTVPSNQNAVYRSDTAAVKRVTNLSGGNYWGKQSEQNVAKSIKEIFTNNFQRGFRTTVRDDIRNSIQDLNEIGELSFFKI